MGGVDYYRLFVHQPVSHLWRKGKVEGWRGKFVVRGSQEKAMTTHMKNSGDEGLSLVEPASRNPLLAPDPVSFSHLSL